ncbi:uncharacterized protein [Primulina huaijiensis]|uniref:uncharacterized protein n=1 Tax=Primulina huaijiensis TaxID=1492673 RepID=UPI003CC76E02
MDTSLANAELRPPILDGTNYSLWKVKIRYYIKSIDERAWQRVINGWTSPIMIDQDGDSLPKPETDWTADEVQNSNYNPKALNAIFTSVDMNTFSLITNCTSAKNAWDTLQRHCEGSESVRRTRLRMLTSKFEMMRMEESENIMDYDRRLREIANEVFNLGDPISNERLVSKKKDLGKTNAFQVSNNSYNDFLQISQEVNELDLCEDSIAYITKKFGNYLKRIRDKKAGQPSRFPSLPTPKPPVQQQFRPRNEGKGQFNSKKYDSVQCRECNGFGHYANECANRLRKYKGYNVSLSDEESDEEEKSNDEDNHTSLTALLIEKHDELEADDEEITLESVQKLYEGLYVDWTKRNKLNSTLMKENTELKDVVAKLEVILSKKNLELGHWYFDSGSSRYMTGSREYLMDYVEQKCGRVTYGGGAKGKIIGKRILNVEGLPKLHNVLHVEELNSNLISISQLCDDNLLVKFDKHTYEVFDESNICIMASTKSSDNCYQIGEELSCKHAQVSELDLWHQKLCHVNFKTLKNLCKYDAVRGMPNLSSGKPYVFRDCQKGCLPPSCCKGGGCALYFKKQQLQWLSFEYKFYVVIVRISKVLGF